VAVVAVLVNLVPQMVLALVEMDCPLTLLAQLFCVLVVVVVQLELELKVEMAVVVALLSLEQIILV
jgi:hypothetical protein